MFKRTVWFTTGTVVGTAVGLGSSVWVQRRVKQAAAKLTPQGMGREAAQQVRQVGATVKAAVAEGRQAAREKEQALNAELDAPSTSATSTTATGTGATSLAEARARRSAVGH